MKTTTILAALLLATAANGAAAEAGLIKEGYDTAKEFVRDVNRSFYGEKAREMIDNHREARDREAMDKAERAQREKTREHIERNRK